MAMRNKPNAALAQLVEHRIRNAGVVGSNPISGTIFQTVIEPTFFGGQIGKPIFDGSNPISGTIFQTVIEPTFFGGQIGKPIFDGSNPISGTISPARLKRPHLPALPLPRRRHARNRAAGQFRSQDLCRDQGAGGVKALSP
jgi:hypothetical protein